MIDLRVWNPDDGDRPDEPNVQAESLSEAAAKFVEQRWSGMDYPESVDLIIEGYRGELYRWTVTATQDVSFSAAPTKTANVEVERAIHEIQKLEVLAADGCAYVNRQSVCHLLRKLANGG